MGETPASIRIGHLKIMDHLILGMSVFRQQEIPLARSILFRIPMNTFAQICDGLIKHTIHGAFIPLPMALDLHGSGFALDCLMMVNRGGSRIVTCAPFDTLSALKGKTLLVPSELSVQHMLVHRLLDASGLSFGPEGGSDIVCQAAPPYLIPMIMEQDGQSQVAGGILYEPYGFEAIQKGTGHMVCTSNSLWKNHPDCVFVMEKGVSESLNEEIQELVSHFFQSAGLLETLKQAPEGVDATWISDFLEQAPRLSLEAFHKCQISFNPRELVPEPGLVDTIQAYMTGVTKTLAGKVVPDDIFTPYRAEKALLEAAIED